jgi:crotonobetainyl-CoA:carnitine CoA-transferase CaiB-like acyl-CoA transferase
MAIMPYSTKQWIKFLLLVGETELADEGWVSDGAERSNRIDELYELIGRVAVSRTNEQWLIELSRVDVPCAVVNELSQVIADPQLATKGLLGTFDDGDLGVLHYLKPAFVADSSNEVEPRRPPHIGEHSREIMRELGMTNRDIQSLVDQRIVGDQRR